jgi:hypothetical protein
MADKRSNLLRYEEMMIGNYVQVFWRNLLPPSSGSMQSTNSRLDKRMYILYKKQQLGWKPIEVVVVLRTGETGIKWLVQRGNGGSLSM